MSSSHLGSSAEARPVLPPRRNLAAGKRLAPLPPGLRSRLRGGPLATSASAATVTGNNGDTAQDLAHTASSVAHPSPPSSAQQPQRSSSKTRHTTNPLANSASPRLGGGKDGRRYLPPVAQRETAQSRSSASSLSSVSSPPASGRLSAPADAAHSRRASNDGPAVPSTTTTTTNVLVARTGPRASTSEGMRRPSPQRGREGLVRPPVASTRVAQPKPRAPGLPRTSGSSSVSTVAAAAADSASASARNGRVSAVVVAAKNSELDAVAEKETPSAVPKDVRASIAMPELPLAPHDMDAAFYTDTAQWAAAGDLPPLVHTLLEGTALEAPYTTSLWTQAYPKPADLLPTRATTTTQFVPMSASSTSHDDSSNAVPLSFQHREAERRQGGFYACVRCATPVCSPSFQVVPAAAAMRGTAAFSRLNLDGVELRVKMPGLESRRRSLPASSLGASSHSSNAGGVELLVHCRHCGGCLGVMLIADVAVAAAVAAPSSSSRNTHQPALTYTQELLCANSACLRYLHYNTRAALDGELLGTSSSSPSTVRGGISGAAAFTAPQVGGGATMGAAFAPARRSAWGLPPSSQQQQLESSSGNGDGADAGDDDGDDSAESSLGDLLDALNPYSGGGGGSGGYDSD